MSLTHRECTVTIHNKTSGFILRDPQVHLHSGNCDIPLPPDLSPTESGTALFKKTRDTACGSVGVFTYNIVHKSTKQDHGRLAVMFSVPYNFNFYSNLYAVGKFSKNKQCDKDLYHEMYYDSNDNLVRGHAKGPSLIHKGSHVTIRASMSDSYQPVLKVDVCDN
ncbi:DELTA-sagatoxin-Srs1a-like [Fundulus heteroclitus]|uniref:DELTA-sagatoxin-Srs1a-like n=1 Tax=Fundulus heteroclitus TaxID=8078 RepID=UPI00165CE078|nr:DELTA-sagatoxin-Srs1a-like [Fundulus heteroclitus]